MKLRYLLVFFAYASCNLISAGVDSNKNNSTNLNNTTNRNNTTNQNNLTANNGSKNNTTQTNNSTTNQKNTTNQSNNGTTNNTSSNNTTQTTNNGTTNNNTTTPPSDYERLVIPKADYFGATEKFNAYYTDPNWVPGRVIYVSLEAGGSDFATQAYDAPIDINTALINLRAGDLVFVKSTSAPVQNVNIKLNQLRSGTITSPIVFYGERKPNGDLGVEFECETTGSDLDTSCFNLERSSYIAIDGFRMKGGKYGVRSIAQTGDARPVGNVFVNNQIFEQRTAGIFSTGGDWIVIESNRCHDVINSSYNILVGGGADRVIIRYNELFGADDAGLHISGSPNERCTGAGIALSDIECHGSALNGQGVGVSEFFTVSNNFFHDGKSQGPNFTSMRNSSVTNNIFGPFSLHGVSFWQTNDEPNLGSSNNEIRGNLFVGFQDLILQFIKFASNNTISENVFLSLNSIGSATDPNLIVIQNDATISNNVYSDNYYIGGGDIGHVLEATETYSPQLAAGTFQMAPFARTAHPEDWTPTVAGALGGWIPPVLLSFPSPYSR